jgi:hypothetical protein
MYAELHCIRPADRREKEEERVPSNGDINKSIGVYRSLCCGREIVIREGATFPDCPNHPRLSTIWKPVEAEIVSMHSIEKTGPDTAA